MLHRRLEQQEPAEGREVCLPLLDGLELLGVAHLQFANAGARVAVESLQQFTALVAELVVVRDAYGDLFTVPRRGQPMTLAGEITLEPEATVDVRHRAAGELLRVRTCLRRRRGQPRLRCCSSTLPPARWRGTGGHPALLLLLRGIRVVKTLEVEPGVSLGLGAALGGDPAVSAESLEPATGC